MAVRFPRRFTPRFVLVPFVALAVVTTVSYLNWLERSPSPKGFHASSSSTPCQSSPKRTSQEDDASALTDGEAYARALREPPAVIPSDRCPRIVPSRASIITMETYPQLNFQPEYMHRRDYWDSSLQKRYESLKEDANRPPLKVIVLPHSHVDVGWLRTFEEYFTHSTRAILDNMVNKLVQHRNMTFIWTEIAFFAMWWESAHPAKRRQVKELVSQGRLEFTSGTWVMTDEATPHLYSMLDQMIEGHQWLKSRLDVIPKSVWSVDTFGHGPVAPYLLRSAGLLNTVVQRIHYGFKRWLADRQVSDFTWKMPWQTADEASILCHNLPFDIYTTKHSCGPDPKTCLSFDFRSVPGEYNEFTLNAVPITKNNVQTKAELLLEQYAKSGSLTPHNVVLALVGDDFRFDKELEWDQQYINYQNLFNYINANRAHYKVDIGFGTLSDYFDAVRQRNGNESWPSLSGDFFPYSDIFSEGRPAYWTGFYTTRPVHKLLAREVECRLRGAEILYTVASNRVHQRDWSTARRVLDFDYGKLVSARRNLALFQHHDAITGTSKSFVMQDYGEKLLAALTAAVDIESRSSAMILAHDDFSWQRFRLLPAVQRPSYAQRPEKVVLELRHRAQAQTIVLYNSDGHFRHEVVRLKTDWPLMLIVDPDGKKVPHQVNPIWTLSSDDSNSRFRRQLHHSQRLEHAADRFQVVFVAGLSPFSLTTFRIERVDANAQEKLEPTLVFCSNCSQNAVDDVPDLFRFQPLEQADIQLENKKTKLLFDGKTGLLRSITKKSTGKSTLCSMQVAAYPSSMFHSGAYLFLPDPNANEPYIDVLKDQTPQIVIISGGVMSEISVIYNEIVHSALIFHKTNSTLEDVVLMETTLDMGPPPSYREHEFFVRFKTSVRNVRSGRTEFFTDQNGFQMTKRVRVPTLGVEANYYPVTSGAFIQDTSQRLNLLVGRAHGFTSLNPGWMEFMIDRRTIHDDGRGMGEGVTDNLPTQTSFVLLLEDRQADAEAQARHTVPMQSLAAQHASSALLYPAAVFIVDSADALSSASLPKARALLIDQPLPCNVHLVGLRTLSESSRTLEAELPSNSALMTLHNRGYDCSVPVEIPRCDVAAHSDRPFHADTQLIGLRLKEIKATTLTGLELKGTVPDFGSITIRPMELSSFNVTFS